MQRINWFWKFLRQVSPLSRSLMIIKTASNTDKLCCWLVALNCKESVAVCVVGTARCTLVVTFRQMPDRIWIVTNVKQELSFLKLFCHNLFLCTRKTEQQTKVYQYCAWGYHHTFPRESTTRSFSYHLPRVPSRRLYCCGTQKVQVPYLLSQE